MNEQLPIVYVRGYGGGNKGIDTLVDDPFYGFNTGSTHVRVGAGDKPIYYQFESPLLRLMIDEGYKLLVRGGQAQYLKAHDAVDPNTIWIHRFYDEAASTFGKDREQFSIEKAASDLLDLILLLQQKTGAPRVHLVAHSMGGLICRSLIQKVIPDRYDPTEKRAVDFVERLFTYASPHGGIEFDVGGGLIEELRDTFKVAGSDIFGPDRMWRYLMPKKIQDAQPGPPAGWDPRALPDESNFPPERVFCLVGTDAGDYGAALGASSKLVGVKSDGLVQIENAQVPGAARAYVHRSHSGRFGIVNSEEGYQNLRRFLFGNLAVRAALTYATLPKDKDIVWQAESGLAIRQLPVLLDDQVAAHYCPIELDKPGGDGEFLLATTFLKTDLAADRPARHTLHLRVLSLQEEGGVLGFFDHLEQTADFDDTLVVDIDTRAEAKLWARWNSEIPVALRDYEPSGDSLQLSSPKPGTWETMVPLPAGAGKGVLGDNAAVHLTASNRTAAA
jgi:hypothetical protein